MNDRYNANNWLGHTDMLAEIDRLKFAVASLADLAGTPGSFTRENAENTARGIKSRLDYLHDSLRRTKE
jgi:hypothetical protein